MSHTADRRHILNPTSVCVCVIYLLNVFLGYSGGYGSAGLGLGPWHRNGWMKGPKQGGTMIAAK